VLIKLAAGSLPVSFLVQIIYRIVSYRIVWYGIIVYKWLANLCSTFQTECYLGTFLDTSMWFWML